MTDLLLQLGVSNLCISFVLAVVAWSVHRTGRWPIVAHLLWVVVLVKLVAPPLVTVPVVPVPQTAVTTAGLVGDVGGLDGMRGSIDAGLSDSGAGPIGGATGSVVSLVEQVKIGLIVLWLAGSGIVLAWSLVRIYRFNRLLGLASIEAPAELQRVAGEIAGRLGLLRTPMICTTSAHLSPMVWWIGGRVRVVIPEALPREIDGDQLRWILAHELAHVRRRDHMVRWLEWLACVGFWWNPVAWWARRDLRMNEEMCCDALVLSSFEPRPRVYANALMTVVEFLASPAIRPPAVASEINSGGFLERRFRMIVSKERMTRTPRWLTAGILVGALGLFPVGVAYGQNFEAVSKRLGEAVRVGELTREQAGAMLDALRGSSQPGEREARREAPRRSRYAQAESDLKKAVEAGRISEEDAKRRLGEMRRRIASEVEREAQGAGIDREEMARAAADIRKMVEAGRISEADARRRLTEMREHMAAGGEREARRADPLRERYVQAEAELKKAVEAGKISGEDARKRLTEMRQRIAAGGERAARGEAPIRERYAQSEAELRKAVEAGKISGEDARERLTAMRERIAARGALGERGEEARQINMEGLLKRIKIALEKGDITREEAAKRIEGAKRRIEASKGRGRRAPEVRRGVTTDVDWDAIKRRIEAAVKNGDMSRKEAEEAYKRIKERVGGERKPEAAPKRERRDR